MCVLVAECPVLRTPPYSPLEQQVLAPWPLHGAAAWPLACSSGLASWLQGLPSLLLLLVSRSVFQLVFRLVRRFG